MRSSVPFLLIGSPLFFFVAGLITHFLLVLFEKVFHGFSPSLSVPLNRPGDGVSYRVGSLQTKHQVDRYIMRALEYPKVFRCWSEQL